MKSKLNKWILNSDQYSAGEKNIDLYGFFFNVIEKKIWTKIKFNSRP